MDRHTLSVHLLVRDEEQNLPAAIGSVAGVADEVVVTDTGSTDGTAAVAAGLGARVGRFAWRDDFAAAWNAGVASCRGDWVLILDADERLLPAAAGPLRSWLARPAADAARVLRRDLREAGDPSRFTRMAVLRLFRRERAVAAPFVGRCHPHPDPMPAARPILPGVELEHRGYLPAARPAKLARSRRLLELELTDRPTGPRSLYYRIELARTLLGSGDPAADAAVREAAAGLAPHADAAAAPLPHAALLLEVLLQWPADRLPPPWTPAAVAAAADRWFPDAPPLLWLRAGQAFAAGDDAAAAATLERLVAMGRDHGYDPHTGFDPAIVAERAALNLAACRIRLGDLAGARRLLEPLADDPRVGEQARTNLGLLDGLRADR
ncbi:putative glycosyltransferase [Phycisphaera mikurensis NBRC 102666]|uniref:Putative glycosyltransferase n=2 Tax=Phycisphaera TaxID=666508 RepID=I0IHB1_PHYMF|nr:putative glycosyltransferase [Phycisphaera mikurensis NBRC 102666]